MITLTTIAKQLKHDTLDLPDRSIKQICIDTRKLTPGDLFIAIKGERFDGHDFLEEAVKKGAAAVIVEKKHATLPIPQLVVNDTIQALGTLAHAWRKQFNCKVIALTGSCGKTSTKTILANVLSQCGHTLSTEGTLNNAIGVPLTLLRLEASHDFAVIELGTNHFGEIEYIAKMTEAEIAFITNIGPVHLEGFGTLEGIAKEKTAIYSALPSQGIAIFNHDDPFYAQFASLKPQLQAFTFGIKQTSDVMARDIHLNEQGQAQFTLHYGESHCHIQLPLLGEHNVINALAAACVAFSLKLPLEKVKLGLETATAAQKRMNLYTLKKQIKLIDDSYNANPSAFKAAIDFLGQQAGQKILVVGDMGELGEKAAEFHQEIGHYAKQKGIDILCATGKLSCYTAEAFGQSAKFFPVKADLITFLKNQLQSNQAILVKGSRSAKMEEVVEALVQET